MRLTRERRWSKERIQCIPGTPLPPNPLADEWDADTTPEPHMNADDFSRDRAAGAEEGGARRQRPRLRITLRDLRAYGYSENCPRCTALQKGDARSTAHHTDACRERIEAALAFEDHPKWRAYSQRDSPLQRNEVLEHGPPHVPAFPPLSCDFLQTPVEVA